MNAFVAVLVSPAHAQTFHSHLRTVLKSYVPEAQAVSVLTREESPALPETAVLMTGFAAWLALYGGKRPFFISDSIGADWQFLNWHFHHFHGRSALGHRAPNWEALYNGMEKDMFKSPKHRRSTGYTYHPVDDAGGNAAVSLGMIVHMGLRISL